jgi:NitT/TauT family transport system substrate-binding protein
MIDEEQQLDIEWVKLINPLNLYIAGAIDATLAKSYNELILFSMSGITPGSVLHFSEHGYDFPEDGLYVSEAFYRKNPEQCRLFAEASRKGWDWVRNNRDEALDIVMKYVKESNVPTNRYNQKWMLDAILKAQEDTRGGKPSYTLDEDAFNRVNEALVKYGYIAKSIVYERFTGGNR